LAALGKESKLSLLSLAQCFHHGTPAVRAQLIKGAVNFLIAPEKAEKCKSFIKNASLLRQAVTLCRSLLVEEERFEVSFMESVRILIIRLQTPGKITKKDINKRVAALIEQSVQSDGVVNLFDEQTEFSLFDEKFMEEVKKMKEKNLVAKLLENLLRGRVRNMIRTNIVTGELFSNRFGETLNRYINGLLTNEEVIQELLKLAQEMMEAEKEGNELGLSKEEKAFYDALTRPQAVKDFYTNDQLVELTKELTDMLRKNRTIDWNRREAERANMRRLVKRLLKKYKYPPEEAEGAMNIVLKQCEQWAENEEQNRIVDIEEATVAPKKPNGKKAEEIQMKPKGSMLDDVEDDADVRRLVHNMMELYEGTTIMNVVVECQKVYQERYFSMKGNDWRHLIGDYVRNVTEQPELQEEEVFRYVMAG
jgi:type I restriction enzyme R subunit